MLLWRSIKCYEKGKGESGRNCNDIKERESPTVKLNEDDDKQRSQDSSSAVATTNEAGKTVTE